MPQTPLETSTSNQRTTRSNSNPNTNITLLDIKSLIEDTKTQLLGQLTLEISRLSATLDTLINRIDTLDKRSNEIEKQCTESHSKLNEQISELQKAHEANINELMMEMDQRIHRSSNVIIFGLPESTEGSIEERRSSDKEHIENISSELNLNISYRSSHRLGRPRSNKPRPMRITGLDIGEKSELLRKARSLRNNSDYEGVYINPDLTPLQQHEAKLLRDELKKRRENGHHDLIIRNGKIVSKSVSSNFQ